MYIGIDIGGTKCAVIKADEKGSILAKEKFATTTFHETIDRIFAAVEKMGKAEAIGISCGGPLDSKRGVILSPPNLPGWDNIEIVKMLEEKFHIKAYLQNDANACALAEWKFGAGKGAENMIFLTFGTGMGAGLILGGRLYDGTNGNAGEIGHIRMDKNGPVGYGKCGSFEGFCSGGGIAQLGKTKALEALQKGQTVSFCKSYEELDQITAKSIADCAKEGFEDALDVYRTCGTYLGRGFSLLIDILNPEKIVVGSIYQRCEGLLRSSVMEVLQKECLPQSLAVCEIVPAALGDEIGDVAAIAVAMTGGQDK